MERTATDAVVPGELHPWCERLCDHLGRVHHALQSYEKEEEGLRREILGDDLALAHRVDALTKDFVSIHQGLTVLHGQARKLIEQDLERPAASEEPTTQVHELRRQALHWIVDVRAHHGEAGTFLSEAVHRDRGVAD
jgi:hypothetical protein